MSLHFAANRRIRIAPFHPMSHVPTSSSAAQRSGMRGFQEAAAQLVAYRQMVERRLQHESEVDEEAADIAEMVAAEQAEAEAAKRAAIA